MPHSPSLHMSHRNQLPSITTLQLQGIWKTTPIMTNHYFIHIKTTKAGTYVVEKLAHKTHTNVRIVKNHTPAQSRNLTANQSTTSMSLFFDYTRNYRYTVSMDTPSQIIQYQLQQHLIQNRNFYSYIKTLCIHSWQGKSFNIIKRGHPRESWPTTLENYWRNIQSTSGLCNLIHTQFSFHTTLPSDDITLN